MSFLKEKDFGEQKILEEEIYRGVKILGTIFGSKKIMGGKIWCEQIWIKIIFFF